MVESGYDVYLSHNSLDKPSVERIAAKLESVGLHPWLDTWHLVGGERWQDELARALRESATFAVFISPNDLTGWAHEELALARERAAEDPAFRLVPVLLPGLPEPIDPTTLPAFLATRTWVDFRGGLDDPQAFRALINAIKGIPSGPAGSDRTETDVCPYQGLRAFDEEHAGYFFGRDADTQRLLEKLKGGRFLAVLGASGSGKSSLVRAGVVPSVKKGELPGSDTWRVLVFRPGVHPLTTLAAKLLHLKSDLGMQYTLDDLTSDPRSLHLATAFALADGSAEARFLYVVDQFEEVFTLCRDEDERIEFFDNLLFAASVPGGQSLIVITIRADFYLACAPYPQLRQQLSNHQFLVGPMDSDGLRQAIEKPARIVGLDFEPGLASTLLTDAQGPGSLPLLQHALLELWKRRRGGILTLEDYRESGGVSGGIAKHAEETFGSLTSEQQAMARRVLLRLIQPGESTEDTRRRVAVSEIASSDEQSVVDVLETLTNARMVTASADEEGGQWIELSHEALIREWPRVQGWLEEDRAGLRMHRRLTEAAHEWASVGRDGALLYRGTRLAEAASWFAQNKPPLNPTEKAFLTAGLRHRRMGRAIRAGVLTILLALAVGGVWAAKLEVGNYLLRRDALSKSPMAHFNGGPALLGGGGDPRERPPAQRLPVAAFALDVHEVTNGQYRLCVEADACTLPVEPGFASSYFDGDPDFPVVYVTARQAADFCRWLNRRLPSEAEWERAARGLDGRPWPWGREPPTRAHANLHFKSSPPSGLVGVGDRRFTTGTTPEGVSHLAGNVWEWTRTPAPCEPNPYQCPESRLWDGRRQVNALYLRGNGWESAWSELTGAEALSSESTSTDHETGFRCAESDA